MNFNVGYTTRGFRDGGERPELAYSGTFFDRGYFPAIGYDPNFELSDPRRRREEHLGPVQDLPQRGDPLGSRTNLFSKDSDWITYSTVVSTSDHDSGGKPQVAIAPGYLQRDWHQNGRHYFAYSMGDVKIQNFYAYVSARYDVKRDVYQGVNGPINIEVYYDPHHPLRCRRHDRLLEGRPSPTTRRTTAPSSSNNSASWSTRATATSRNPSPTPSPTPSPDSSAALSILRKISTAPTLSPRMSSPTSGGAISSSAAPSPAPT